MERSGEEVWAKDVGIEVDMVVGGWLVVDILWKIKGWWWRSLRRCSR